MSSVRRHPLITFFVLAYALSWWPWILYALDLSPQPIAGFGPFLAAIVVLAITRSKTGVVALLRRMVRWRVAPVWYAVALLLPVAITVIAAMLNVLLGAQGASSADLGGWPSLIPTFFILLLVPGLGGAWEEPGWRGYALPRLQTGRSALVASLMLGVLWALWHSPFVVTGVDIWIDAFLFPIEWAVVYTWAVQQRKRKRVDRHAVPQHEQHLLQRVCRPDVLRGRLSEPGVVAPSTVGGGGTRVGRCVR